jgi:transmembrane sensor
MQLTSEQIQILLVEKLAGTIEEENNLLLERLIAEDPAVRQQWLTMQEQLGQLGGAPQGVDEEEAWRRVSGKMRSRTIPMFAKVTAAAAVILLVVGAVFLVRRKPSNPLAQNYVWKGKPVIVLFTDNGQNVNIEAAQTIRLGDISARADRKEMVFPIAPTGTAQWSTLAVPSTMDYKLSLPDGTGVWLNAQTRIHFPSSFQGARREVYVQGEAFFKVSKDRQHPFIVHAGQTEVQVLGTSFNINTYATDCSVTSLVEGAVINRDAHGSEIALRPGTQAVYSSDRHFSTRPFDETEVLSWMKGIYYFHDTPLKDISKVISRWYNAEVYFKDTGMQSKTFSGQLDKAKTLQVFLDNLNLSEEMHAAFSDGKVIFQ